MEELKFNIEPIENAFDFALSALEYISNKHDKSALKYAILHLSSGMEIILKEPLRRKHWAFIFEDVNKPKTKTEEIILTVPIEMSPYYNELLSKYKYKFIREHGN